MRLFFMLLFASSFTALSQKNLSIDACGFWITDTLDQGCGDYSHGHIWTHCECEIQDFELIVRNHKGYLIHHTHDINTEIYFHEIHQKGFQDSEAFYWTVTGFVVLNGEQLKIGWNGIIWYWH